jgi:hypothetical protein
MEKFIKVTFANGTSTDYPLTALDEVKRLLGDTIVKIEPVGEIEPVAEAKPKSKTK